MKYPIFTFHTRLWSICTSLWIGLSVGTALCWTIPAVWAQTQPSSSSATAALPSSLKIVKLLWSAQPKGAASSLEKAIDQALTRNETKSLVPGLTQLSESLRRAVDAGPGDPRYTASLAALTLCDEAAAIDKTRAIVSTLDGTDELQLSQRQLLLRCWTSSSPEAAGVAITELLQHTNWSQLAADRRPMAEQWLPIVAATGLQTHRDATAEVLLARWSQLPRSMQVSLIEPLTQQPLLMKKLVAAIERGAVPKDMLNTNQLRKWNEGQDQELVAAIERVWGKLRMNQDEDRKKVVEQTLQLLRSGRSGDPAAGELTFKRVCIQCHRLHGEGLDVGPEITSNGRGSFDQLVSNVMDPSLVIGKAFLAKTVLTQDGRVIAGIVAAEDDRRLTLKVQGGQLVELNREDDIDEIKESAKSLMPDGLEKQMSEQELLDLFAYLSLARALSSPENELIPGTPATLVK